MTRIPYASEVGSLLYIMMCTLSHIAYVVGLVNIDQLDPNPLH